MNTLLIYTFGICGLLFSAPSALELNEELLERAKTLPSISDALDHLNSNVIPQRTTGQRTIDGYELLEEIPECKMIAGGVVEVIITRLLSRTVEGEAEWDNGMEDKISKGLNSAMQQSVCDNTQPDGICPARDKNCLVSAVLDAATKKLQKIQEEIKQEQDHKKGVNIQVIHDIKEIANSVKIISIAIYVLTAPLGTFLTFEQSARFRDELYSSDLYNARMEVMDKYLDDKFLDGSNPNLVIHRTNSKFISKSKSGYQCTIS